MESFSNPVNVAMLQEQAGYNEQYQRSLNAMRQAYAQSNESSLIMNETAIRLQDLLENVRLRVVQMPAEELQRFDQYRGITQIRDELRKAQYLLRIFMDAPTDETVQRLNAQLDAVQTMSEKYDHVLGTAAASIRRDLGAFREAVKSFENATFAIAKSRQEMTDQQKEIVRISDALYAFQLDRLHIESGLARNRLIVSTVLAILLGILAAWLITRQIVFPLRAILSDVQRITSGDLTASTAITRKDELGVLQKGIQQMSLTLREVIGHVRDSVAQISSAAEEQSTITTQTSAGVNSQKVETDQVATAMHEMATTVQDVARNAEQAAQAATDADIRAREGDRVVAEVIAQIERMASEVVRSSEAMAALQQDSDKIGSVMGVIRTVAEQTNLLALNAAIEAARAGEAGRGFAVVADEVRSLAQRTQQSTHEIEQLVTAMQTGTQQVVEVMSNSRNLTESSVALTRQAGASLTSITSAVSNIQGMNQQIATAAEQQSVVAEQISRNVLNVRDISEQTATASSQIASSSVELARVGSQLRAVVSRFRI